MPISLALLALSIASVWLPHIHIGSKRLPPWVPIFVAAVATGIHSGGLAWPALPVLAVLVAATWGSRVAQANWARTACTALAILVALALMLHLMPGFRNPMLVSGVRVGEGTTPLTTYLNFDKATAGLFLLVAFCPRARSFQELRASIRPTALLMVLVPMVVLGVATMLGYTRVDAKRAPFALAWLLANLLFTCVAEEALFRGFLQDRLARLLLNRRNLQWLPVVISAALFGLAHAAGGATLILLAALGGLGYSIAFALTRRIESAVLVHFAVNALHFTAFSYPHLAR